MNILLIQPPLEDFYTTPIRLYPLGLLYAAATLQKLGCKTKILDCLTPPKKRQLPIPPEMRYLETFIKNEPLLFKNYYHFGMKDEDIVEHVRTAQPDMIGISSQFTAYFHSVQKIAELIKDHLNVPIFIGGHHATAFGDTIKKRTRAIDYVLTGPAEQALPQFLAQIDSSRFEPVAVDWKNLRPAHSQLHSNGYRMGRKNYISMTTSRGCPYKCEFCSVHNMFGRSMDYRYADDVIDEMRENYIDKDVRIFNFEDDNISADKKWFTDFMQRIVADPVLKDIELTALNGLCYPSLDQPMLELLYRAGFRQLHLSYVTHDDKLRRRLQRPGQKARLETTISAAQKIGFFITVYVIIGLPGQTFSEAKQSIDYLLGLNVLVGPSIFYIPPASDIYDKLDLSKEISNNWNLYRSSAFAVETKTMNRKQLVQLFVYTRQQNLMRKKDGREL